MKAELMELPALDAGEVQDVLKQVGLIAGGALAGTFVRSQLSRFVQNETYCTAAELGLGVLGAAAVLRKGPDFFFWPLVGVAVHGAADLLRLGLDRLQLTGAAG